MIVRVILPYHLRNLAQVGSEVEVEVVRESNEPVTLGSVLDAIESTFPMLRGTIRDHGTLKRRDFLRYFACENDFSHEPLDTTLPDEIASGKEPFIVLGAIAGG